MPKPFRLLRWFSFVSLVVTGAVTASIAYVLSHFFVVEAVNRDGLLTTQFIRAIAEAEVRHAGFGPGVAMGEVLDQRRDLAEGFAVSSARAKARAEFYDHVRNLPDSLVASVMAPDRVVIWSSNQDLVGLKVDDSEHLDRAFREAASVAEVYPREAPRTSEKRFLREPKDIFIENYIPLKDRAGNVVAVVEVYKEPASLTAAIRRGYLLIWLATAAGAVVIYLSLFWIVRRASKVLQAQQTQLVESERLVVLGEMASAVAHGLRNPLASIRSSAELAQDVDSPPVRKNINDIISQVDRLSKWVRELLVYSRPLSDDREGIDLSTALAQALKGFDQQVERAGIVVEWQRGEMPLPRAVSNCLLLTQVLNSVLANAIEAMTKGGRLRCLITAEEDRGHLVLTVSDSGPGMTEEQLGQAFKPFYTTKRGGLGVGLVLVKRIMERFGGEVKIESQVGVGTEVHLIFDVSDGAG